MNEINRTEIATIGEFGLIDHLTADIAPINKETVMGVGDDAAILKFDESEEVLVTTGSSARVATGDLSSPVDAMIVGVVDKHQN